MSDDAITRDRGDIWISDVIDAWRALELKTPEVRAQAAEALGFDAGLLRKPIEPASATTTTDATADSVAGASVSAEGMVAGPATSTAPVVIPSTAEEDNIAGVADEGAWLSQAPPLQTERSEHLAFKPPHIPLFRQQWTRNLVSAMCAVQIAEGAVDEPRLVDAVTRLRPVVTLPRRFRPTLRRGVQLLIDRGEAMMPFSRDIDDIARSVRATVGRDRFVAAAFVGTPLAEDDVLWLRSRRRAPWQMPTAGTPVLLITDLGLTQRTAETRGATIDEWVAFAVRCRVAGCPTVVILPRRPTSCPPVLCRAFSIVAWDQRTNIAEVLRNVRVRA